MRCDWRVVSNLASAGYPGKKPCRSLGRMKVSYSETFFTAGLQLPVSKRFVEILAAYNMQIHQLTPNSIPQIMKFLWTCHTFAGDNDVETLVRHFEIHWAKRVITVEDEEKEAQYGCYTFQT
jgi:hypothetical protein